MEIGLINIGSAIDERGELNFINVQEQIPFKIQNFFFIKNVPKGQKRACHSNQRTHEILIPVSGTFNVELNKQKEFEMDSKDNQALLIPSQNWIEMYNFSEDAVCVVLGSEPYDQSEKNINA